MNHRRFHWLEKTQVQLATVAALAVVYFLFWPHLHRVDPLMPVSFLANGGMTGMWQFAALIVAMAVVVGLVTVTARAEGAVLAVLVGAGAVSLRSPSMSALLRFRQDDLTSLFYQLIAETLILAAMALLAGGIVIVIRRVVGRLLPRLMWRSPIPQAVAEPKDSKPGKTGPLTRRELISRGFYCLLLTLAIATVLLLLLLRSDEHGQVIFAVVMAFMLAMVAAHSMVPGPFALLALAAPVLVAIGFYLQGSFTVIGAGVEAWTSVPVYVRVLPVDWMTFGIGGVLMGYWFSSRVNDMRRIEADEKAQAQVEG